MQFSALFFLFFLFTEIGKQQFLEAGGLESLREFSYKSIFDDKRWDRLLNRACTVLCKVCQAKPLPVEVEMSPAKFNIPDGHLVMPEGTLNNYVSHARPHLILRKRILNLRF